MGTTCSRVAQSDACSHHRAHCDVEARYGARGAVLGRGSHGEVRLYADASSGTTRAFAVKEMDARRIARASCGLDARAVLEKMREEYETQRACACAHVVKVYECARDARAATAKLVTEYCARGAVMDARETFEPMDLADVRRILRSILRALRVCHERDVAHHDVKPQNVFVAEDGTYKLGDFGCATRVARDATTGEVELVCKTPGTPAFTAPECCEGEPADGFKADVWAAGATAHALATGAYAYRAENAWETYQKILQCPLDFADIDARGDEAFSDLMRKLLDRDPTRRLSASAALEHAWFARDDA